MSTKGKILEKSLELFNKEGVEQVTTRDIAKAIGKSQGNLHYHYASKNIIIQQLFSNFLEEVKNAERYKGRTFQKEDIILSMKDNFRIMYKYRFLFKDNELVWRRLPEIKEQTIKLFNLKRDQIIEIIKGFKSSEIFRKEISEEQINFLADQFIFSISSWLVAAEYMTTNSGNPDYFAKFTFRIWLPYLHSKEMEEWEKLLG